MLKLPESTVNDPPLFPPVQLFIYAPLVVVEECAIPAAPLVKGDVTVYGDAPMCDPFCLIETISFAPLTATEIRITSLITKVPVPLARVNVVPLSHRWKCQN